MNSTNKKIEAGAECIGCEGSSDKYIVRDDFDKRLEKPSVLLHSCCGPCSTAVIERLVEEFNVTVFYYNPCITEEKEYMNRRRNQIEFIEKFNEENIGKYKVHYRDGDYRPGGFLEAVKGLEDEPEGGARCQVCFRQRLEKTAEEASMAGYDYFGTTLTVSPHKNYRLISEIGRELALRYSLSFLDRDFKKQNGFARSVELSKKYNLYRQKYCGCKFSNWLGEE
jgi:hypothetical protein